MGSKNKNHECTPRGLSSRRNKKYLKRFDLEMKTWPDSDYVATTLGILQDLMDELVSKKAAKAGGISFAKLKASLPDAEIYMDRLCRSVWLSILVKAAKQIGLNWCLTVYLKELLTCVEAVSIHEIAHICLADQNVLFEEIVANNIVKAMLNWRNEKWNIVKLK